MITTNEARLARVVDLLSEAESILGDIVSDREIHFADRSERWQESELGAAYEERTSDLQDAHSEVEAAMSTVEEGL